MRLSSLDIVIVNWNAGGQLGECLSSIAASSMEGFRLEKVVVVDNGSWDGSTTGIEAIPLPVTLIENRTNRGFAAACNQGARPGSADILLFLNPDVKLFADSLAVPAAFLQDNGNGNAGIAGIQLIDDTGGVTRNCARFPKPKTMMGQVLGLDRVFPGAFPGHFMTEWGHGENRRVDQVMGAFFMVRRKLFEALGGFDERFFVYYEDLDFSLRAKKAGYDSWYLADARAFHKGGGTSDAVRARRLFYFFKSRVLFGRKHFGKIHGTALLFATLLCEPFVRTVSALTRGSLREVPDTFKAVFYLAGDLPLGVHSGKQ